MQKKSSTADGEPMSHALACEVAAQWFRSLAWCQLAITEIAGVHYAPAPPGRGKKRGGGVLDVLGLTLKESVKRPRIAVCEVKVSRADLLSDLRARKMLRYESQVSHCYLAFGPEVFSNRPQAYAVLNERGLPSDWGIVELSRSGACQLRAAKRIEPPRGAEPTLNRRQRRALDAARSATYRYSALVTGRLIAAPRRSGTSNRRPVSISVSDAEKKEIMAKGRPGESFSAVVRRLCGLEP